MILEDPSPHVIESEIPPHHDCGPKRRRLETFHCFIEKNLLLISENALANLFQFLDN